MINILSHNQNKDIELNPEQKLRQLIQEGSILEDEFNKDFNKYKKTKLTKQKKQKYLLADATNLTQRTVKCIIEECLSTNTEAAFLVIISLFTGRSIDRVKNNIKIFKDKDSGQLYFRFGFKLKKFKLTTEVQSCIYPTNDTIELVLPDIFSKFEKRNKSISSDKDIKELIKGVKTKKVCRFTLKQIDQYMTYWMVNNQFDTTEIAIINGKSIKMVSGVHYYRSDVKRLNNKYYQYIQHLLSLIEENYNPPKARQTGYTGSNLALKDEAVTKLFNNLSNRIMKIKILTQDDIEERHNLFVIYTLLILNVSTGHRPVNDPYQTSNHMDLNLKTVYIGDKNRGNELPFRTAVLTEIAYIQMNNYYEYLKNTIKSYEFLVPGLKQNILNMINGDEVLFMFMKNGKFKRIKNKNLKKRMKRIFPIKLNWHRHYIRSKFPYYDVTGQKIDMWMGHNGKGGYGLSQFSGMSMEDLDVVSKVIDKILSKLNISPLRIE